MKNTNLTRFSYSLADQCRWIEEDRKSHARTDFERDRARILHSSALRRLGEKTQVLGPASDDFIRTRLTHSLEVAQVGRTLGQALGCDPDLVDTACLAHDLGHPPFGHNGERALQEITGDIGGFEGNAQTFRLLARLEPKVVSEDGQFGGLNLTRAALDSALKYPWQRGAGPDSNKSLHKFGVYSDDYPIFSWVKEGQDSWRRPLETQIMDLADDIAYSVHDIEDGIQTGRIKLADLGSDTMRAQIYDCAQSWYGAASDELESAWVRLRREGAWLESFAGSYRDMVSLKNFTSQLIGRFATTCAQATRQAFGSDPLGRYQANLIVPDATSAEINLLKGIAAHLVMTPRETELSYLSQRTILFDLVAELNDRGADSLEEPFRQFYREAEDSAKQQRAIIDQVACLTDRSAQRWHANLCGMFSVL